MIENIAQQRKLVAIREAQYNRCKDGTVGREEYDKAEAEWKVAANELENMLKQYASRVDKAIEQQSEAWNKAMTEVMMHQDRITVKMASTQEETWKCLEALYQEKKDTLIGWKLEQVKREVSHVG